MNKFLTSSKYQLLGAVAGLALATLGQAALADGASLSVEPVPAPLDGNGSFSITGTGLPTDVELILLMTTNDGLESDVTEYLDPGLKIADDGSFSATMSYGRFVKRKLISAGEYELMVTDDKYNVLSATAITFADATN